VTAIADLFSFGLVWMAEICSLCSQNFFTALRQILSIVVWSLRLIIKWVLSVNNRCLVLVMGVWYW
jgi:hypothetical protein